MTVKELIALDRLLVKLQAHIDASYMLSPKWETATNARKVVHDEIERLENKPKVRK